jgi:hypothetical protein
MRIMLHFEGFDFWETYDYARKDDVQTLSVAWRAKRLLNRL